jgi:acyl-coenzyme A thioesterase PaaI-like protein
MNDIPTDVFPPPGYTESKTRGPFSTHNGPYFHKIDGDRFWHAIFIGPNHCNSGGHLHGGMAASFADGLLSTAVWRRNQLHSVTISLTCSYIGAGKTGTWLEGTAYQTALDGNIAFATAEAWTGDETIFTATGVFRLLNKP